MVDSGNALVDSHRMTVVDCLVMYWLTHRKRVVDCGNELVDSSDVSVDSGNVMVDYQDDSVLIVVMHLVDS